MIGWFQLVAIGYVPISAIADLAVASNRRRKLSGIAVISFKM
jgi:hypothetical protein